ncbi:MAG: YceI family protein [Myxococcota bacterium]|jgi:polyisoprenoid-binding protein YceI|nr:YceI family protein [Myxococcota bacterium]
MKRFAPGTTLLCLVALAATSGPVRAAEIVDGTLTYHVDHRFKSFDAVMPASAAELALTVDPAAIEALTFTARIPLGSFDSGNQLRDEHAAEALELFLFANASWTAESVEVLTRDPADGPARQARVRVSGPLVLRGEIRTLTAEAGLAFQGDSVAIQASFPLSLDEYGIHRPSLLGFKTDDTVTVTVNLSATLP